MLGRKAQVRANIGDLIEIRVEGGLAYALHTHRSARYGTLIRVFRGVHRTRPSELADIVERPVQFTTFAWLSEGIADGLMSIATNLEVPEHLRVEPIFKIGIPGRPPNYWIRNWFIRNVEGEDRRVGRLPAHSIRIPWPTISPPLAVVNHIEREWNQTGGVLPDTVDWDDDEGGPEVLDGIAGFAFRDANSCVRARIGDVIEIPVAGGYAYGLLTHDQTSAPHWGPLLRVFRGIRKRRATSFKTLLRSKEQFATFTLLSEAIRRESISIVANVDVPKHLQAFPSFKRQLQVRKHHDSDEMVHHRWVVWTGEKGDDGREEPQVFEKLPPEYVDAPINEITLPENLVRRIESDWCPAHEVPADTVLE
jgi:hypothetical protein